MTGTAGIEYRPFDDTMLFAKYSRGYKAGGFNNLGFGAEPYTDPEFVDALEGGWKQTWADWGLTTNAAVFIYKYTDAQAPLTVVTVDPTRGPDGVLALREPAGSPDHRLRTRGQLEPDRSAEHRLHLRLPQCRSHRVGRLRRRLARSALPVRAAPIRSVEEPATQPYALCRSAAHPLGRRATRCRSRPKNKLALNASYRFDMADGSYFLPTMSYSWRDAFYDTFFNNPKEKSPSYDNLDARLNWYSADKLVSVTAWVRNLTDEDQTTSISADTFRPSDLTGYQTYSYSMPRMFGLDVIFHLE